MNILFEVTSQDAADILVPLASACDRAGVTWGCFFTGDGVHSISSKDVTEAVKTAVTAIVCEASWEGYMGEQECPVELGSQTNNSTFVGDADKIISL
jgi:hypothetical protein